MRSPVSSRYLFADDDRPSVCQKRKTSSNLIERISEFLTSDQFFTPFSSSVLTRCPECCEIHRHLWRLAARIFACGPVGSYVSVQRYMSLSFSFSLCYFFFPRSKVRNAFRTFSTGVREIFPLLSCRRTVIISIQLVHLHSHPVPQHPTSTRLVGGTVHV